MPAHDTARWNVSQVLLGESIFHDLKDAIEHVGPPAPPTHLDQRLQNRLRNVGGAEALLASNENSWRMLGEMVGKVDLPRLYCTCGTQDFLYSWFTEFRTYAQEIGAEITFDEYEGYGHEWRFWDMTIQKALTFFGLDQQDSGNPF